MGILVEYKGKEEGPAHIPAAEGELQLASIDFPFLFDPLFSSSPPSLVDLVLPLMHLLKYCGFHPDLSPICFC